MERLKDKERELYEQLTGAQKKVYLHLRNDRFHFKNIEFYDKQKMIAEYLDISEKTVKRAIKRLQEIGLLNVSKKWKVNKYTLPCYDNLENKVVKETKVEQAPVIQETPKQEDFNIDDLEVNDTPDNGYWNLYQKVKFNGEINRQITALRNVPESSRKEEQQRVINMIISVFGVRKSDAEAVVNNINEED